MSAGSAIHGAQTLAAHGDKQAQEDLASLTTCVQCKRQLWPHEVYSIYGLTCCEDCLHEEEAKLADAIGDTGLFEEDFDEEKAAEYAIHEADADAAGVPRAFPC